MEEIKEMKIQIPEGYEIDEKNSTFKCIKFKKIPQNYPTYKDLKKVSGYFIVIDGISKTMDSDLKVRKIVFKEERHAKMAMAAAQISQLMPYYGGEIIPDEYYSGIIHYRIEHNGMRSDFEIIETNRHNNLLEFHTKEQASAFVENNRILLKDYFMID
jgi:hypothetical protein